MCDEELSLNVLLSVDNVPAGETAESMAADFLGVICWTQGWLSAPVAAEDGESFAIAVDFDACPFTSDVAAGRRLAEGDVEFSIVAGNMAMNALEKTLDDDESVINTAGAEILPTLVGPDATAEVAVKKDIEEPGLGLMGVLAVAGIAILLIIICCCFCCCRYVCKCCCTPSKGGSATTRDDGL